MELIIFNIYRADQKAHFPSVREALKRIPCHVWLLFVLLFLSLIIGFVSLFSGRNDWITLIAVTCEVVFSIALFYAVENYQIKNSMTQLDRYWEHCGRLKKLLENVNIRGQEATKELMGRIDAHIQRITAERQSSNAALVKIGEIIAVPVLLAIITAAIDSKNGMTEKVSIVVALLFMAIMFCGALFFIYNLFRFPKKQKLEQMVEFREGLQGVLDLERFNVSVKDEAENTA